MLPKYKRRFMKISELVDCGLPEKLLYQICHTPRQRLAFRIDGKGPWRIDTTKLDEELARRITR